MTHSYQYLNSTPFTRRKLNARFVHQLKKLCGGKHKLHVNEIFADDDLDDYTYVHLTDDSTANTIISEIKTLCERYGIGSDYIEVFDDEFGNGQYMHVYLSKKKPYCG